MAGADATAADRAAIFEACVQRQLIYLRAKREAERRLEAELHPPIPSPALATLRERLASPRLLQRYRIEGWLPLDSRVMCAAQYKTGKTTLVSNLVRSLVDGDPWLGEAEVTPIEGSLVLIDTEMAQSQLDDWYRDQGIAGDDRVVVVGLRGALSSFNILEPDVRSTWAGRFRSLRASYVVLDCLRPMLDALGLDEQHDAGRFLVAFDDLLRESEVPEAAVIHHMGHGGERSRGDSRLRDWPDVEWKLVRESEDASSARFISAYGRDVEIPEAQLRYDPVSRRLSQSGGSRRESVSRRVLEDVILTLKA